jgi:hypothetical protein
MRHIHRSRSLAPVLNALEGRVLLSGSAHSGAIAEASTMTATEVVLTAQANDMHKTKLTSVGLMAEVKSLSGVDESTIFGTMPVNDGMAMLTLPARKVLNMPLTIVYSGDSHFMSSTDTPAMLTKSGLKGMTMGAGMKM